MGWLVPLGLVSATVASFFVTADAPELERVANGRGLAAVAAAAARGAIETGDRGAWYLIVFGSVLVLWFGYGVVRALLIVHALAWREHPRKVRNPVLAGAAFTAVAVVLGAVAAAIGGGIGRADLGPAATVIATVVVYAGAALAVSLLFPHGGAPPRALVPGALLISAGGLALHVFVGVYLAPKLGRSVDLYGVLGASTVILLWLYLIASLITLSAFLNSTLWFRRVDGKIHSPPGGG